MTGLPISSIVIALGVILVVGVCMLTWGLRGKRIGDAPHCRECDYNLTGLESQRCPECATEIDNKTVMIGSRHRRPGVIVVAALLLLFSGGGLAVIGYDRAKTIEWIRYYPVGQLMRMAERDDAKGLDELVRRMKNQSLPKWKAARLIPRILVKHGQESMPPNISDWAALVFLMEQSGWLSAAQRDQFFAQVAPFKLRVRERIREGDPVVAVIETEDRGCPELAGVLNWKHAKPDVAWRPSGVFSDGAHAWRDVRARGSGKTRELSRYLSDASMRAPGAYQIECSLFIHAFAPGANPDVAEPYWSRDVTLKAKYEVLSADEPDPIRFVTDDSVAKVLRETLAVKVLRTNLDEHGEFHIPPVLVNLAEPSPVSLAFEVLVVTEDGELPFGRFLCYKGEAIGHSFYGTPERTLDDPREVTIVLRPSRKLAAQTLNGYEFWGDTITVTAVDEMAVLILEEP